MFQVSQIPVGGFDSNFSYLICSGNGAAVIDPCGDVSKIRDAWEDLRNKNGKLKPSAILITHAHPDHISGVEELLAFFPAPVCASPHSKMTDVRLIPDGGQVPIGSGSVKCIVTPGHSRDSVCWMTSDGRSLFTGDTLFIGCCGFGVPKILFSSLAHLKTLDPDLIVYSGHDYGEIPFDTLGHQMKVNRWLAASSLSEFRERMRELI